MPTPHIPSEIWLNILSYLKYKDLKSIELASKRFHALLLPRGENTSTILDMKLFRDYPASLSKRQGGRSSSKSQDAKEQDNLYNKNIQTSSEFEDPLKYILHPYLRSKWLPISIIHRDGGTVDAEPDLTIDIDGDKQTRNHLLKMFKTFISPTEPRKNHWMENAISPSVTSLEISTGYFSHPFAFKSCTIYLSSSKMAIKVWDVVVCTMIIFARLEANSRRRAMHGFSQDFVDLSKREAGRLILEGCRWAVNKTATKEDDFHIRVDIFKEYIRKTLFHKKIRYICK